jgi:hypothetical protein
MVPPHAFCGRLGNARSGWTIAGAKGRLAPPATTHELPRKGAAPRARQDAMNSFHFRIM